MPKSFQHEVAGRKVIGLKGHVFGEVSDLFLTGGKVTSLEIQVASENVATLGLKKPFWRKAKVVIPWKFVRGISDTVTLKISLDDFGKFLAKASPIKGKAEKPAPAPAEPAKAAPPPSTAP
ncbi:MAG: PRC-barrel domain-containing protein [Planctomycetota bacterium]|nr:PRC-barrel domain-containing protein [Planctomycetota bacterium]